MKDLNALNTPELRTFFNSFDTILCDVDGVLWFVFETIPGTAAAVESLKKIGKTVAYISNNTAKSIAEYKTDLETAGFHLGDAELITPLSAITAYLDKKNITKEVYALGMPSLKSHLSASGFTLARHPPRRKGDLQRFIQTVLDDGEDVEAIIADADIDLTYIQLIRAANYLKNPDVLFISGASDKKLVINQNQVILGPGYFHKVLEEMSGRKSHCLAKPSALFNEFIVQKLKIDDPSRVLFIGDSITEDMVFASFSGYTKLLVFSGLSKKSDLDNWNFPEHFKPDYYIDSISSIQDLIKKTFFAAS